MKYITEKTTMIGQISRRSILLVVVFSIYGCPKQPIPKDYVIEFFNKTDSELVIQYGSSSKSTLKPNRLNETFRSISFFENENPLNKLEQRLNSYAKAEIYRSDSLIKIWNGPVFRTEGENNFFNLNSWTILNNHFSGLDGSYRFTIYPEDLVQDTVE